MSKQMAQARTSGATPHTPFDSTSLYRGVAPIGVWIIAALTFGLHLACRGGYGYFRDELYFIACGHHLAWGYVDQPPLIALAARLTEMLSFGSLTLFRLPANFAHVATIFLAARLARRLGASVFGEIGAAICTAVAPVLLAQGQLLTMNAFEPLIVTALTLVILSILQDNNQRRWLWAGAMVGIGILNKHSMLFFALCLVAALALMEKGRARLRSKWFAAALGVTALIVVPHALWQIDAGFPILELLRNGQARKNEAFNLLGLWKEQFLEMNPAALPVLLAGLAWSVLRPNAPPEARLIGWTGILAETLFALFKAKAYYLAPLYPMLFAAGGTAVDAWLSRLPRIRWFLPAAVAAVGLVAAPSAIPVLSVERTERYLATLGIAPPRLERMEYRVLPQQLADQFGWPEMARAVARVHASLTPEERARATVLVSNYGEAAAIDLFGPRLGLSPASSGHNNYFLWGPHGDGSIIVAIGGSLAQHARSFEQVELASHTPPNPHGLPYEDGRPIYILRKLRIPMSEFWPRVKNFI